MEKILNASIIFLRDRIIEVPSCTNCNLLNAENISSFESSKKVIENNDQINNNNNNNKDNTLTNSSSHKKFIKDFLIRKCFIEEDFIEVRCAVVGNVDSGKSTLLG